MAIVFLQEKKTQKNLIIIFIIVMAITVFVIWRGLFKKNESALPVEELQIFPKKEVKINFNVFKNPILAELQIFTEIIPFKETTSTQTKIPEKLGRENPFISY